MAGWRETETLKPIDKVSLGEITRQDLDALTAGLGQNWMITGNGYKPYASGVVLHPLIDAMIEVSRKSKLSGSTLERVEIQVHPDVVRITGVDAPGSGLMSKFSANHAAAVAFIDKAAGVTQFSDERANDPSVQALRKIVQIKPVSGFRLDESVATIYTKTGDKYESKIEHATGTVSNRISDTALEEKFIGNATPVIGSSRSKQISEMVWGLDNLMDVGDLARLCA
jgi:2-methylcitrate dehydratase PrpD